MNNPQQLLNVGHFTGFASSVAFTVAFILTLWPGRRRVAAAALLYALGLLSSLSFCVYFTGSFAWIVHGLSRMNADSSPVLVGIAGLLWPLWISAYAIGAVALLWPSIPQARALLWGKLLHLALGLPPSLAIGLRPLSSLGIAFGVGWLAYALLWFRIREYYVTSSPSSSMGKAG